jgi:two-component system, chemotaxis family, protein-glutamate methylesterase/glutaminase
MKNVRDNIPAGGKIRVLVVDDSALMRRMISRIFEGEASIELVGTACDGFEALLKIEELKPHLVTLDVEMPGLDGMETLRKIMERHAGVRVIMLSSLTEQGAQITIDALMHGASDYVTKPAKDGYEQLGRELLSKVRQFFPRSGSHAADPTLVARGAVAGRRIPAEICAIGVSTGGPSALVEALPMFPKSFPLPIVIVQHMPPMFTHMLALRLASVCQIPVVEGEEGMILEPGQAVIAPGGFHMRVVKSGRDLAIRLDEGERENSCRPAVDVLFRSIVESMNGRAIAAILTGMGQDGLIGAQQLKARGATILVQDQASSVVWGMPGAIVAANLADAVLPLGEIVPEILQRIGCR